MNNKREEMTIADIVKANIRRDETMQFIKNLKSESIFVIHRACSILTDVKNAEKGDFLFSLAKDSLNEEGFNYSANTNDNYRKRYLDLVKVIKKLYNKSSDDDKDYIGELLDKISTDFVKYSRIYYKGESNPKVSSEELSLMFAECLYSNMLKEGIIKESFFCRDFEIDIPPELLDKLLALMLDI